MAVDLLSILAILVDPKRLWSSAKLTVNNRRGRIIVGCGTMPSDAMSRPLQPIVMASRFFGF
jgi:hypothetical protein